MGYQMVTWPMTSRDPERCCEAVRSAILATAWLLARYQLKAVDVTANLIHYMRLLDRCTKSSVQSMKTS